MQNQKRNPSPVVAGVGDPGYLQSWLEQAGITDPG
jgi:hypothetical protein